MNLKKNETLQLLDDQVPESVEHVAINSIDGYLEETPMDITVEGGFFTDAQGILCKNCGSHSLEYIKKWGLKGLVNLNTTSKPAKTASVLTGHLNTFLASMQAYYAGALGLGYVNILYAPLLVGATDKELKQIGQELIFNCSQNAFSRGGQSLHPDELIWVKENGTYKNVPIGEYVDKYLEENKDVVEHRDQYELLRTEGKGIETVSFDEETGESLIKEVSYLARMPHKGKMYRFETSRGNINITGDHSVFVYTKEGKITVVKASELKIGDLLIAPSYVPDGSSDIGNNNDKEEGKQLAEFVVLAKELTPVDSSILSKSRDFKSSFISTVLDLTPHKEGYSSWRFSKDDKKLVSLIGMILLESGECPIVREEGDEILFDVDDDPEVISNNHGDTDLLTVEIDYIEEYDYEGPVYDISVPGTEAFLGGVGNIYLHNTLFIDTNIHSGIPSYLENVPAIGPGGHYYADADGINIPLEERTIEGDWCLVLSAKEEGQDDRILLREHDGKQTFYDDGITHVMRYGDYKEEAARFAEALLEVWKEGDANGHVFEFPKCDFHVSAETFTDARQYRVFQKACELASHNGSTYFVFDRDSVSLASCCFAPMTPVLIKDGTEIHRMSIVGAYLHYSKTNKTIRVYDRGAWRKAKVICLKGKGRRMLTIKFACNKEVTCTADHEFPTRDGVKKAYELTSNDLVEMSTEVLKNRGDSGFARLCGALATLAVFTKHPKGQGKLVFDVCNDIDGVKIGMDEFLLGALRDAGIKDGFAILPSDKGTYIEITNPEIINGVEELYTNVEGACCFSGRIYNTHEEARFAVLLSMLAATAAPVEMETEQAEYLTNQLEAIATTVGVTLYNDPSEEGRLNFSPTIVGVKDKILNYGEKSYIKIESIEEAPEENWVYCFSMMDTKKPFFTLPSGIVTHNCRLKVQITDMSLLQHPERLRTSFPRNELIVIRRNGGPVETISMGRLFDEIEQQPIQEGDFEVKYLENTQIWDKNGWTGLQRIVRHPKTASTRSDMLTVVRTDSGSLLTLTDNHPVILAESNRLMACPKCGSSDIAPFGTTAYGKQVYKCYDCNKYSVGPMCAVTGGTYEKEARDVRVNDTIALADNVVVNKTKTISTEEAYILGVYIGDGSMYTGHRTICISKPENHPTIEKVKAIVASLSGKACTYSSGTARFSVSLCPETLQVGNSAYMKQLPPDFLSWTPETFGAVVSGLIDTDGSVHKGEILVSSISKVLVSQIHMYLDSVGIPSTIRLASEHPEIDNKINGKEGKNPTHLSYNLSCNNNSITKELFKESIKVHKAGRESPLQRKWTPYGRSTRVSHCTDEKETFVYDVTTDSHTFVSDGVLYHNCGFQNVTINIPQCAYRAKHRAESEGTTSFERINELFLEEINHMMDLCKAAHAQKRKFIESIMVPGSPMWQMAMPSNDGKPYLNLDTCVYIIGMLGLNDAIHYLTGEEMHESDAAMDYALKIMSHMFLRSKEYSKETGLTFKLEESPAESAARRLAKADLVYYRDDALKVFKGTEDAAYYTNSIHLAAAAPVTLVERIRKQSMFHSVIESGAIIHAFIGEQQVSPGAIEELVTQTFLRTQCAQLVFSPEFTYCLACGSKQRGLVDTCNQCGSHNVVGETRVVGYYSRVQNWSKSKRYGELVDRHKGKYRVEEAQ